MVYSRVRRARTQPSPLRLEIAPYPPNPYPHASRPSGARRPQPTRLSHTPQPHRGDLSRTLVDPTTRGIPCTPRTPGMPARPHLQHVNERGQPRHAPAPRYPHRPAQPGGAGVGWPLPRLPLCRGWGAGRGRESQGSRALGGGSISATRGVRRGACAPAWASALTGVGKAHRASCRPQSGVGRSALAVVYIGRAVGGRSQGAATYGARSPEPDRRTRRTIRQVRPGR